MENSSRHIHDKVIGIFAELAPDRSRHLSLFGDECAGADAISSAFTSVIQDPAALGFHVSDVRADAAFLVALHLFPDRFTREEIVAGVSELLAHVPYHLEKAAEVADESPRG